MIAFSGTIGSGLFINTGLVLATAGPGGAILSYFLVGTVYWSVIACLGEMVALMPVKGPITEFPSRYLGRSVGFAVGWMYWLVYALALPAQITVASSLMEFNYKDEIFWKFGIETKPAIWIFVFLVVAVVINTLPVQWFGEIEYIIGSLKLVVIVALILLMMILADGRATPQFPRIGYRSNWKDFFAMQTVVGQKIFTGNEGRFLSIWSSMTAVIFGYIGMEIFAIAAADTELQRAAQGEYAPEIFKIATRKICVRIITLYCFAALSVSFVVNYRDSRLLQIDDSRPSGGQFSPFILAVIDAEIHVLPHLLNAFFIVSAMSAGINALYVSSRTLHALAIQDKIPFRPLRDALKETRAGGNPWNAVGASGLFGILGFLGASSKPDEVFQKFVTITTIGALIVNIVICLTYIFFLQRLREMREVSGDDYWKYDRTNNRTYPFRSHWQPPKAYYGLISCTLFLIFNGYRAFMKHPVDWRSIIASYISPVIFVVLVVGYKIKHQNFNFRRPPDAIFTGIQFVDGNQERRGRLNLRDGYDLTWNNFWEFGRWVLVWMK